MSHDVDDRRRARRRLLDVACFTAAIVTGSLSRRRVRPVGSEARRALPGDELLPAARGRWTHAVRINARPREIWSWLVQMGCRRAGWYSYDWLDNGGIASASRVVPELQSVEVGDLFAWTPTAEDGFFVAVVDPERALVLRGSAGPYYNVSWAFVLEPIDQTSTRLLVRGSGDYDRVAVGVVLRFVVRPIHFAMQRKQLLNIKRRAEHSSADWGKVRTTSAASLGEPT
ncbi:MAG TPA: hypothetical protein VMU39_21700 [Solirubrobacteraceae bacterium]|nr:hypothetical protein [Solirubrobacteraceae bacterium]